MQRQPPRPQEDYYVEHGCTVFTAAYLLRRGACCNNGCRHCPYGDAEAKPIASSVGTADAHEPTRMISLPRNARIFSD